VSESPLSLATPLASALESKFSTRTGAKTNRLVLTADQIKRALFAIEVGASPDIAAGYAGLDAAALKNILSRGAEDPLSPHAPLVRAVEAARARHAVKCLGVVNTAAMDGEYKAAQWLLERAHGYAARSVQAVRVDDQTGKVRTFAAMMAAAEEDDRDFGQLESDGIAVEVEATEETDE
jgi:hypothetical protein